MRIAIATLALLLAPLPVGAAELVLGKNIAHDCFDQADHGRVPSIGLKFCDDALKNDVLNGTDRQATLVNRGILRARARDQLGALDDYGAALQMNPNDGEAYLNRSASLIALKRYKDAVDDADRAIALGGPRLEIAYYNRGLANEALGNVGQAYEDYKQALTLEPRLAAASTQLRRFRVVTDGT